VSDLDIYGYGTDVYGYRKKFGVLVPSTNTTVEVEYNAMRPEGVITATRPCQIPPLVVNTEDEFVAMVKLISEVTEPGLRNLLSVKPDHVVFGYSAETFWDGKQRSDAMFNKYNDIAQEIAGCSITFGAQALQDAFALYPDVKKVAVISPYAPIGNVMVKKFLGDIGYEVVRDAGHSSPGPIEIAHESFAKSRALVKQVDGDDIDLILQAGTNLAFAPVAAELERELGKPVLAINAVTWWHALRSNGIPDRIQGFGSLLAEH
jgi:maleate isomerase